MLNKLNICPGLPSLMLLTLIYPTDGYVGIHIELDHGLMSSSASAAMVGRDSQHLALLIPRLSAFGLQAAAMESPTYRCSPSASLSRQAPELRLLRACVYASRYQ